ncbi:kinase-like domain-containing protein [Suillus spraguei]|nr:kinase-like domain-containing protein [Suillus spraguei]
MEQMSTFPAVSANLYSPLPSLRYPSDPPSPATPVLTHTFTDSGTAEVSQIPPVPYYCRSFRVWGILAEGGFATAIGAQDVASNRLHCLKVFRKDRLKHRSTERVVFNELEVYKRIVSSMPFPAIKFIMGLQMSFQTKDYICFAMDLMAGDLRTCMTCYSTYCSQHAVRWTAQIALGINALHEIGIIHRDIKPDNILIDVRENVRITDFGLSYLHKGPLERQWGYTDDAVGTTHYMAPEILHNKINLGSMKYGTLVDWWALGCVIYELFLSKHEPLFATEDAISLYVSWCYNSGKRSKEYPAFRDFPENIGNLISGLLEPIPMSRYGFYDVVDHEFFLLAHGTSEFSNPYIRALARKKIPESLPELQYGRETRTAPVWFPLHPSHESHVSNVDWIDPAFPFSS